MEVKVSSFILKPSILGVLDQEDFFINFFHDLPFNNKTISIDRVQLTQLEKRRFINRIEMVTKKIDPSFLCFNVYQYMRHHIMTNHLKFRDYQKKIKDSLGIVGLKSISLSKRMIDLSNCEKKLLQLATSLLSNPDIIIFDSFLESFDTKLRKKLYSLFTQLVERYKKIIILCSRKADLTYKYTTETIVIQNKKKLLDGPTEKVFCDHIKFLLDRGIEIPEIIIFSYQANLLKNAKLNYHKDPRDLIKDIYKKV